MLVLAVSAGETTLCGVILEKVSEHLWRSQVVDSDNLITLSLKHLTESKTADAAESVNCYFNHFSNLINKVDKYLLFFLSVFFTFLRRKVTNYFLIL